MKKQLLALALVAGIGAATWSDIPRSAVPTSQVGFFVGLALSGGDASTLLLGVYRGMQFGAAAGSYACKDLPALRSTCARIGRGVGMR